MTTSTHLFVEKLRDRDPEILSVFLDGIEILRIERGVRTIERPVATDYPYKLLTIHFENNPEPEYTLALE